MSKTGQPIAATEVAAGYECVMEGQHTGADTTSHCLSVESMDDATGLLQFASLVSGIYARVSERHDLTPVQARLLCVLLKGPRGMAELAHYFGVEKAALTGLMNRTEKRGLAQRSPVPGDRRAVQVTLTDGGRQAAAAFHVEVSAELSRLVSHLAPEDREHFRTTMTEIITRCRTTG